MSKDRQYWRARVDGEWAEGYLTIHPIMDDGNLYIAHTDPDTPMSTETVYFSGEIEPGTECQCIGRRDSKGKCIYEGDLLFCEVDIDGEICTETILISWDEDICGYTAWSERNRRLFQSRRSATECETSA